MRKPVKSSLQARTSWKTTGTVYFVLSDELGQTVLTEKLSEAQNFAQYQIGNLSNGLYYWKLKDSSRIIKADKIVIMK